MSLSGLLGEIFDFEEMWGKAVATGLFLILLGCGLSLWSYLHRDSMTGEFFIWPKTVASGMALSLGGLLHWFFAR